MRNNTKYLLTIAVLALAIPFSFAPHMSWEKIAPAQFVLADLDDAIIPDVLLRKTFSGSYLSARFAQRHQDWETAQNYMSDVTAYDPDNIAMVQRAFLLTLGAGHFNSAKTLAEKIAAHNGDADLAQIFLAADAIRNRDYNAALKYLSSLPDDGFGQFTKPLMTAWAMTGMGKHVEAIAVLDGRAAEDDPTFHAHAGLMQEVSGNKTLAATHYQAALESGVEMHTALSISNFYERAGSPKIAAEIAAGLDRLYSFKPFSSTLKARQATLPQAEVKDAADGTSMALFDLATLLYGKRAYESAKVYASLALLLNPKSAYARMMLGDIEFQQRQFEKSIAYYEAVDTASAVHWLSRLRVAEAYDIGGNSDKAISVLTALSDQPGLRMPAMAALGDLYRRHEMNAEAVGAYDVALNDIGVAQAEHWSVIYARGLAKSQMKDWNPAEKDILQALNFQPKNPMILNFIAYNWANQGINLDRALDYARQASALKPDDGYILDSYGWTLFRMKQYQDAISCLERAVEAVPGDATLLDHLGDAYWMAGRKNEANYQWRQAKDLSADAGFRDALQQKMKSGISTETVSAQHQAGL